MKMKSKESQNKQGRTRLAMQTMPLAVSQGMPRNSTRWSLKTRYRELKERKHGN
jgi:hypothetical protein